MKLLVVFFCLVGYAACADTDSCYNTIQGACTTGNLETFEKNCDAKYGGAESVFPDLQKYANTHITRSFEYLLMSSHFGTYEKSRAGFEKLYRQLSDASWDDAIDLIKYITKRGGTMNFNERKASTVKTTTLDLNELESLGLALDIHKSLAEDAHHIHKEAIRQKPSYHDPEVSSFIENHFVHKHAEKIRELSGHSNDLKNLLKDSQQTSLSLFLFDEYLSKL